MSRDQENEPTRTSVILSDGTMVSSYRILKKIGAGGMGEAATLLKFYIEHGVICTLPKK